MRGNTGHIVTGTVENAPAEVWMIDILQNRLENLLADFRDHLQEGTE